MEPFGDTVTVVELLTRILCDIEPPPEGIADGVYLFGQTADNEDPVLEVGASLFKTNKVKEITLLGGGPASGYPGFPAWHAKLVENDVPSEKIIGLPQASLAHTHTEAIELVCHAKTQGWKTVYISGHPLHQFRTFVNTVSITIAEYPELRIYNKVGTPQPWTQQVVHSQGTTSGRRSALITGEIDRIVRYHKKGDVVTAKEVLKYLNRRDEFMLA